MRFWLEALILPSVARNWLPCRACSSHFQDKIECKAVLRKEFLPGQKDREFVREAGRGGKAAFLFFPLLCLWYINIFETSFSEVQILLSVPRKEI